MKNGLRHPRPDSEPVVDISVTYNTTSTYGRFIRTQPNLQADNELLEGFKKKFAELASTHFSINLAGSGYFNDKFILDVEEAFTTCLSPNGTFEMFSDVPDHLNRPMGRYILKDKDKKYNHIVDAYLNLDVRLVIPAIKRFFLANVFHRWAKVDPSQMVPRMLYRVRLWNTPVSYYLLTVMSYQLKGVEYTHNVERARELVGYPKIYDPKDRSMYERIDYDIRRAIFNEISPVVQEGSTRENLGISGGDNR